MKTSLTEVNSLYKNNVNTLYKYFYYKTLSHSDAEDLTSDTFLKFTKAAAEGKDMTDRTKYLYGIAKNVFLHYLRNKYSDAELIHTFKLLGEIDAHEHFTEHINIIESLPTLEERALFFINQLPEKQKELITLRLIEKMTPTQISTKINKDTNYVKTTLKRGMRSLKQLVACTPSATTIVEA